MGARAKPSTGARRKRRASKRAAQASTGEQHRYYPDSIPPGMAHEVFDVSRIDEDGLEVLDDDEVEPDGSEPVSLPPPSTAPRSLRPSVPSRAPHPPRPSVRPRPLQPDDLRIDTPLSYTGSPTAIPVASPPETNAAPPAPTGSGRTLGFLLAAASVALLAGMVMGRHGDAPLPAARAEARPTAAPTPAVPTDAHFSRARAEGAIDAAVARAQACRAAAAPSGPLVARLTFAQTGQVVGVDVRGPLAGTEAGACFAAALREARVPAFDGGLESVERTVSAP
jgi:hypothetical protein